MAIYDIVFLESDYFEMEIIGVSGITNDILFDNPLIEEVIGTNGTTIDVLYSDNTLNEIPNVLITDFAFL